ncbi:hypothetical protein ACFU5Y_04360 [Streptomyces gardneri]|uniref:hypothetical protein n=1 Tax=Streptomyces gardneri TaxID=66892 RepID=UPI0036792BAB
MQMSEPFATTVAAVAPMIWLVGTVEFHRILKRMEQNSADRVEQLDLGVDALRTERDDDEAERMFRKLDRPTPIPRQRRIAGIAIYMLWYSLTLMFVLATIEALQWLAEDGGPGAESGASEGLARFLLAVLSIGFFVITLLPMLVAGARLRASRRRRADLQAELQQVIKDRRESASRRRVVAQACDHGERSTVSPSA